MSKQIKMVWFRHATATGKGNATIKFVRENEAEDSFFSPEYPLKSNDQIAMIESLLVGGEMQVCVFSAGVAVTRFNPNFGFEVQRSDS